MSVTASKPYHALVKGYAELVGATLSPAALQNPPQHTISTAERPKLMLFSPHPDDECIVGGLALRLLRQSHWQIYNVAVTLGSRQSRRTERWQELQNACAFLDFSLLAVKKEGLDNINPEFRSSDPTAWSAAVERITGILHSQQPQVIGIPHAGDWNRTHIGTHYLVLDALATLVDFSCFVLETEFWGGMAAPNLMVEMSNDDLADLVYGLSLHTGEVARNPYHLRLPAWMIDNVRRGAEVVCGQGASAPDFTFATLYRLRYWHEGRLHEIMPQGRSLACHELPDILFTLESRPDGSHHPAHSR